MKTLLKALLLFNMVLIGICGVITVDIRSGAAAGYPPTMEVYIEDVELEEKTEGFSKGYEFTIIVNNKEIAKKLHDLEKIIGL